MNIAFAVVKNIGRGGGIERYTEELGARLVQRGHAVRVYSMRHYGRIDRWHRGMRVLTVPCCPGAASEKLSAGIAAVVHAAVSPWADLVHLHSVGPGAMGWLLRWRRRPALVQFHGIEWQRSRWSPFSARVLKFLEHWSVRGNREVTAVSQTQCDYFRQTYGITPRYIPGGAETKTPVPANEIAAWGLAPQQYVLFASRLVPEKGAHYLVEAFRRLATPCRLVIAGDVPGAAAYREKLRRLAANDPRIVWPGYVEGRLLDELFSQARIYVQPSDVEGLSLALLEAMSYGRCCLASDIPENCEALAGHGATFHRGDTGDLAAQLQRLLDNPAQAEAYAAGAAEHVRRHYSWDRITDSFEQYYQEIIRRAAPHPGPPPNA